MIAILQRLIKRPNVPNKDVSLPCLRSSTRVIIIVKKEGRLQSRRLHEALRAVVLFFNDARKSAKYCVLQNWYSDSVEADALSGVWWCNTLRSHLDIFIRLQIC